MWAEFVYCTGSHSVLIIRKICTCFIINVNEEIPEETNMRKFGNKWYWTELLCSALMAPLSRLIPHSCSRSTQNWSTTITWLTCDAEAGVQELAENRLHIDLFYFDVKHFYLHKIGANLRPCRHNLIKKMGTGRAFYSDQFTEIKMSICLNKHEYK